jgi:hypothetical protein
MRPASVILLLSLLLAPRDAAVAQLCLGGCDDHDPCTDDRCEVLACVHVPASGASCADHDRCTAGDRCQAGTLRRYAGRLSRRRLRVHGRRPAVRGVRPEIGALVRAASERRGLAALGSDLALDLGRGGRVLARGARVLRVALRRLAGSRSSFAR